MEVEKIKGAELKKKGYVLVFTMLVCMLITVLTFPFFLQAYEEYNETQAFEKMQRIKSILKGAAEIGKLYTEENCSYKFWFENKLIFQEEADLINCYIEFYNYDYANPIDDSRVSIVAKAYLKNGFIYEFKKALIVKMEKLYIDKELGKYKVGKVIYYKESSW